MSSSDTETVTRAPRRSRRFSRLVTVVGILLLAAAVVGVGYPLWWNHRSATGGERLLHEALRSKTHGSVAAGTKDCQAVLPSAGGSASHLAGILEVPSLELRAPVLQGLGNPVLNIAVGHDPASPWPGAIGESVVEAHDVSYFSGIDALKPGSKVVWRDACVESVFKVISTEIVPPGTLLQAPSDLRGLALITCYPTNALFWTPERFVVLTTFVSRSATSSPATSTELVTHLTVPVPHALFAEGLTLQDNPILLGTLSITGSPSPRFREGPGPLEVEAKALESFFAAQKAIAQGNQAWWRDISVPGLSMPAAWANSAKIYVDIEVSGTRVRAVELHSVDVTMHLVVSGGTLLIASLTGA
ncbi:MAG: class D sortase [Acidimicrobiales bacterium]